MIKLLCVLIGVLPSKLHDKKQIKSSLFIHLFFIILAMSGGWWGDGGQSNSECQDVVWCILVSLHRATMHALCSDISPSHTLRWLIWIVFKRYLYIYMLWVFVVKSLYPNPNFSMIKLATATWSQEWNDFWAVFKMGSKRSPLWSFWGVSFFFSFEHEMKVWYSVKRKRKQRRGYSAVQSS